MICRGSATLTASESAAAAYGRPLPLRERATAEVQQKRMGEGDGYRSPIRGCCNLDAALSRRGRATVLFVKRVAMADDLLGWRLGW